MGATKLWSYKILSKMKIFFMTDLSKQDPKLQIYLKHVCFFVQGWLGLGSIENLQQDVRGNKVPSKPL